jgi:hypothetical protein
MISRNKLSVLTLIVTNLLLASVANAQDRGNSLDNFTNKPVVSVGGFVNAAGGFRDRSASFDSNRLPDAQLGAGNIVDNTTGTQNSYSNQTDFANDSEIHIKVGGINEFGMKYGAIVELEADVSADGRNEGLNADKSYVFTESRSGRFEFGNNIGANQKMKVGPSTFARAAGGINGKYLEYINLPMLADSSQLLVTQIGNCDGFRVGSTGSVTPTGSDCANVKLPRFILIPQSPIAHGGYAQSFYNRDTDNTYTSTSELGFNQGSDGSFGELEDATKISYYTPRVSGWQSGISFAPDSGNSGSSASISGDISNDISNVIGWGANYSNNFGNLGLALSATGEVGKYEQITYDGTVNTGVERSDLNAYDIGLMATYFGFTVGASYGSWGDSLSAKSGAYSCQYDANVAIANQDCTAANYSNGIKKFDDASYWTAGLAYQFGPMAFSATHIDSEFQSNQYSASSVGLDYRMAKGLLPYIEITKFSFDSNQANGSDITNQATLSEDKRQIKDNEGYVILTGILFSF